jgi:AbiV family abortive infection protein
MEKLDQEPNPDRLTTAATAWVENGKRLLADAIRVLHLKPPATAKMLAMIAQEEFAKAFVLGLVRSGIVPWTPLILRAMNDHTCKQLVGLLIEYVDPAWEELKELQAIYREEFERGEKMPLRVTSALEILRYEKIGRWANNHWGWAEDPGYDSDVLRIAEGKKDKAKQDALYVRIGRDGSLVRTPQSVTAESAEHEIAKAKQYQWSTESLIVKDRLPSPMFDKVRHALKALFRA